MTDSSDSKFFLKLVHNSTDLYLSTDYFIEVWDVKQKLASFGGSYADPKEKAETMIAKNLNTINMPEISYIEKSADLQEIDIDLKSINKIRKSGIKHNLVKLDKAGFN